MSYQSFPELDEHKEINELAKTKPQEANARAILNVALAIVNTRSQISSSSSWIKGAVNSLDENIKKSNESSDKLSSTIARATWWAVRIAAASLGIASLALIWDIYKTICINQ